MASPAKESRIPVRRMTSGPTAPAAAWRGSKTGQLPILKKSSAREEQLRLEAWVVAADPRLKPVEAAVRL